MKTSYLFLADGFEEIEALAVVDILRRAGIDLKTVSIMPGTRVTGAHGIPVEADCLLSDTDCSDALWLILPGGLPGAKYLAECEPLGHLLKAQAAKGHVAAICASPAMVLGPLGIIDNRRATGYPGTESLCGKAIWVSDDVVVDGKIVTANGPATALKFAYTIVGITLGESHAREVAAAMLYHAPVAPTFFG